jgi:HEAT repeat protein
VRNTAVQAIGKLHGTAEIDRLSAALADSAWWVRFSAAQALFSLGEPGITILKTSARDAADRYAREMSTQVLAEHGALPTGAQS